MESTVHIQICYASTFNFNLTSPLWIPPSVGRKKKVGQKMRSGASCIKTAKRDWESIYLIGYSLDLSSNSIPTI